MPLTVPSHQGVVLPLKLWRPRWFDGVALVIGSAAPDLAYAVDGFWLERPVPGGPALYQIAHGWAGILLWVLPVTVVCGWLLRRTAPMIAAHLPGAALRDFGALATAPRWYVTVTSSILGGASHLLWDELAVGVLDTGSSVLGAIATIVMLVYIGRKRLIGVWHGPPPVKLPRPLVFWPVTVAVALGGMLILTMMPGGTLWHTVIPRALCVVALAAILASAAVNLLRRPPLTAR